MQVIISGDSHFKSGISQVVEDLCGKTNSHFASRGYGSDMVRLGVILMCRDPNLKFQRRVRFSKREKTLYMDVMFESLLVC